MHGTLRVKRQSHKMAKDTQTIRRQQPTNCFSVFKHFVGLALEGLVHLRLNNISSIITSKIE